MVSQTAIIIILHINYDEDFMSSVRYSYEALKTFCCDAFEKFGFTAEDALKITDVLLLSDLYGIESHGMQRLVRSQGY